jgi:hypothetical protein
MDKNIKYISIGIYSFIVIKALQWSIGLYVMQDFNVHYAIAIAKSIGIALFGIYTLSFIRNRSKHYFYLGILYLLVMPIYFVYTTTYKEFFLGYGFRIDHLVLSYVSYLMLLVSFYFLIKVRYEKT